MMRPMSRMTAETPTRIQFVRSEEVPPKPPGMEEKFPPPGICMFPPEGRRLLLSEDPELSVL